jgi:hypothetical protein
VGDNGRVLAMTFDLETGATGELVVVSAEEAAWMANSADGRVLALLGRQSLPEELVLCDRSGNKPETVGAASPRLDAHLEFSPDGRRVLLERPTGANVDLKTVDVARKAEPESPRFPPMVRGRKDSST